MISDMEEELPIKLKSHVDELFDILVRLHWLNDSSNGHIHWRYSNFLDIPIKNAIK